MANRYSKNKNLTKAAESKSVQGYEERRRRLGKGARIMALVLVSAMVVFYVLSAGLFLWD